MRLQANRATSCAIQQTIPVGKWDCAVKLVDGLAGESPASADYPVGTVVISGDGAGDQTVGSPEVKALDGWIYSGQLRQESKPSSRA